MHFEHESSPSCPNYTAPAATAVPSTSMDGSMTVAAATSTTLFKGAVPPNAFMVRAYINACVVNDNGPAGVTIIQTPLRRALH
jgi:hypothetical protein